MFQETRPFRNSNLFSNHYLEKLVRDGPEWREADPGDAFRAIKELYERKARVLENYNESQLEENFIRPLLRILGHHFGVQGKVSGKDRTQDYAFSRIRRAWTRRRPAPERIITKRPWR